MGISRCNCVSDSQANVGPPSYFLGFMHLGPVKVGARTFIGNSAYVPTHTVVGSDALVGVCHHALNRCLSMSDCVYLEMYSESDVHVRVGLLLLASVSDAPFTVSLARVFVRVCIVWCAMGASVFGDFLSCILKGRISTSFLSLSLYAGHVHRSARL